MHAHDHGSPKSEASPKPGPARSLPVTLQRLAGNHAMVQASLRSGGAPLPDDLRTEMEGRLGAGFGDVRVHTGPSAHAAAAEVQAQAFTSGSHIVFGAGAFSGSATGKHLLAHELTHVIQQRHGPVAGTDSGDGLSISDPGDRFERAAEANAARTMSGPASAHPGPVHDHAPAAGGNVQRKLVNGAYVPGELTASTDDVQARWGKFKTSTTNVENRLFTEFLPTLAQHRKSNGRSKNPGYAPQLLQQPPVMANGYLYPSNPISVFPHPTVRHDPEKTRAKSVAKGLLEWTKSATEGAERYYAEMRQTVALFGGGGVMSYQFGVSDKNDPDSYSFPAITGQGLVPFSATSVESKRTASAVQTETDKLIREARAQSDKRVSDPAYFTAFGQRIVAVEIDNPGNPWPFTPTTVPPGGLTPADLTARMEDAVDGRTLFDAGKAPKYHHRLRVTYVSGNSFVAPGHVFIYDV
ncbi:eCIS core domain-containing protein [Winogradskya humida]|uniref:eCIS core domain-containing protein n=1 Tax=Winogradskya humida TaxID=113566 RepID=A0ABQ3ZP12_9ACTN|nr:DUF4157 domain-containing protein [Actinoplanes humidus]GIE20320.1 hypothetical protein Ahu01nite_034220 [Actinoplanes humidus]